MPPMAHTGNSLEYLDYSQKLGLSTQACATMTQWLVLIWHNATRNTFLETRIFTGKPRYNSPKLLISLAANFFNLIINSLASLLLHVYTQRDDTLPNVDVNQFELINKEN